MRRDRVSWANSYSEQWCPGKKIALGFCLLPKTKKQLMESIDLGLIGSSFWGGNPELKQDSLWKVKGDSRSQRS